MVLVLADSLAEHTPAAVGIAVVVHILVDAEHIAAVLAAVALHTARF